MTAAAWRNRPWAAGFLLWGLSCVAARGEMLEWKGFLTAGYAQSDVRAATVDGIDKSPNVTSLTRLGLIGTLHLGNEWDLAAQFLARGRDSSNFAVGLEWGLVTWRPRSDTSLRLGKQRLPTWLVSDYIDTGALYPWVRPPSEIYGLIPVTSFTGAMLFHAVDLGGAWHLDLSVMAGGTVLTIRRGLVTYQSKSDVVFVGGTAMLRTETAGVRVGYLRGKGAAEVTSIVDNPIVGTGSSTRIYTVTPVDLGTSQFLSLGANLDWEDVVGYVELASQINDNPNYKRNSAGYLTLGYHLKDRKFLPHVTFGRIFDAQGSGQAGLQTSVTPGLVYAVSSSLALKGEYSRIWTSGGAARFIDAPRETASLWAFSVDAVF